MNIYLYILIVINRNRMHNLNLNFSLLYFILFSNIWFAPVHCFWILHPYSSSTFFEWTVMSLLLLSKFHRLECRSLRLVTLVNGSDVPARVSFSIKSFVRATASLCQNTTERRRGANVDSLLRILKATLADKNVQA